MFHRYYHTPSTPQFFFMVLSHLTLIAAMVKISRSTTPLHSVNLLYYMAHRKPASFLFHLSFSSSLPFSRVLNWICGIEGIQSICSKVPDGRRWKRMNGKNVKRWWL